MSWLNLSVREVERDKVGLALAAVLSLHLLGIERIFVWLARQAREATKHVDSSALASGSEFNSRRLHHPMKFGFRISDCGFEIRARHIRSSNSQSAIRN